MKWLSFCVAGFLLLLALASGTAGLANNTVQTSNSAKQVTTRTLPELLPPECAGMTVTAYILGVAGSLAPEIIMGTSGADVMTGGPGDDCMMGGAGDDAMTGGPGTHDVCIGGPGVDTFDLTCEVRYQ